MEAVFRSVWEGVFEGAWDELVRVWCPRRGERRGAAALRIPGPHIVLALDLIEERVDVRYDAPSDAPVLDVGEWEVVSERGKGQRFKMPAGTLLPPGAMATVWSGPDGRANAARHRRAGKRPKGSHDFFYTTRFIWNNDGDVADLLDEAGSTLVTVVAGRLYGEPSAVERSARIGLYEPQVALRLDLIDERLDVRFEAPPTARPLAVGGWRVESEKGHQSFVIPRGTRIPPRACVTFWTGPKAERNKERHMESPLRVPGSKDIIPTRRFIWNNDGDIADLYDTAGNLVVSVRAGPDFDLSLREETLGAVPDRKRSKVAEEEESRVDRSSTPSRRRGARAYTPGRSIQRLETLPSDDRACVIA